jgi:hypothetical protein
MDNEGTFGEIPAEPMGSASSAPAQPKLREALALARAAPDRREAWDSAEEIAAETNQPDEVARAYREALARPLPADVALALCERAARFLGEWFEDTGGVVAVLKHALAIEPEAAWAFSRLSLLLTVEKRWSELLEQYDRVLERTAPGPRRTALLTEAAQMAKDLAGAADRAIAYLGELAREDPGDAKVIGALERLLRREGRYRDLVELWRRRLAALERGEAQATRLRIAECLLDGLASPVEALPIATDLLDDPAIAADASALLERILSTAAAPPSVREQALSELRRHHAAAGRSREVARVLRVALATDGVGERAALHRDVADLLAAEGELDQALEHRVAVVRIDPSEAHRAGLRAIAERTGQMGRYAEALAEAAESGAGRASWSALVLEAADVLASAAGDPERASALLVRVLDAEDAPTEAVLTACRRLDALLERAGRTGELVGVLERRAGLEPDAATRRELRGRAARLADELGEADRALASWSIVLTEDSRDREALAASVALLERDRRWPELVEALARSASAADTAAERRATQVRAADVLEQAMGDTALAIDAWRSIEAESGADDASADALIRLLARTDRGSELASVLERAVGMTDDPGRAIALRAHLGDVRRARLDDPLGAAAAYEAVLARAPGHPEARAGLAALLDDARSRARAVALLVADLDATGDDARRLDILEARLSVAPDDRARSQVLMETARVVEEMMGDAGAALALVARALPLAPDDEAIEAELMRLARDAGDPRAAAGALARAAARLLGGDRAADLALARGRLLEEELDETGEALDAYAEALALVPASIEAAGAVLRAAARADRWDVAARTVVASAEARTSVEPALITEMERAAESSSRWPDAAAALASAIEEARDLDGRLAGEIERRIATWYDAALGDLELAEAALVRALSREGARLETLAMLAGVQRRAPSTALVDTLLEIADLVPTPLDALHEAASVAMEVSGDDVLARPILGRLLDTASSALLLAPVGSCPALGQEVAFALSHLVRLALERRDHVRAVALLVEAARLPLEGELVRSALHQAAAIAEEPLGDFERAATLYKAVLDEWPDDELASTRLAAIFASGGRHEELLALRRRELARLTDPTRRIALRLEIGDLLARLGRASERYALLLDNLTDEPAHAASIEAIAEALADDERFEDLASILENEADRAYRSGAAEQAAELWSRAGDLAELRLRDLGRALAAQSRAAEVTTRPSTLDALARLHAARGDHGAAVAFLEQRLEATGFDDDDERVDVVARLAEALARAGRPAEARACLERALVQHPRAAPLRDALRALYRSAGAWEALVELLASGEAEALDPDALREAADVCLRRLDAPARAVPILESLVARAPSDRASRLALARTLERLGELAPARALLTDLIAGYGRRRPPERAEAHFRLAAVAAREGDRAETLTHLEAAVAISPEHTGALRLLGELSLDAGELERAERVLGALLLLVLRHRSDEASDDVEAPGFTDAMIGLYRMHLRRGEARRADEMLTSAFESAAQSDVEALRLEAALRRAGDDERLLRALELRLACTADDDADRPTLLAEIGAALGRLGRHDEALDRSLVALAADPSSAALREGARRAARRTDGTERYVRALELAAEQHAAEGDLALAAALHAAAAEALDADLDAPQRALEAYARAEELGEARPPALHAMDRLYTRTGDRAGRIRVLRRLVTAIDADPAQLTDDLYRLAELELNDPDERSKGLESLEWALERDARYARAGELLRGAADALPDAAVLSLYEAVTRASGDRAALLDALDRAAREGFATMDAVREAVDLAGALGDADRATDLLHRAVEIGAADSMGLLPATWALLALGDRYEACGDAARAIDFLQKASEAAEPDEAIRLTTRVAGLAADALGSLALAAQAYERLIERGLLDREVWDALLAITRGSGDRELLAARLASAIDAAFDPAWRSQLRMERAHLLLDERPAEAAAELGELLDDDDAATAAAAAAMLTRIYEEQGDRSALGELYERRLAAARERGDSREVEATALRLGALLEPERPVDAIDVYQGALEAAPRAASLLRRLVALYGEDDRPEDRADVMERLLELAGGPEAEALALDLSTLRERLGDDEAAGRALELGARAAPASPELGRRLAAFYEARELWAPLAEMRRAEGEALAGDASLGALREAARLYDEHLEAPGDAADVLAVAAQRAPDDAGIALDRARCLDRAGRGGEARDVVAAALARGTGGTAERVALLRLRADMSLAEDDLAAAAGDLEASFALDPASTAPVLVSCLERLWATPEGRRDRTLLLRFAGLLLDLDREGDARALYGEWLAREPEDAPIARKALDLDLASERWDDAAALARRLVAVEQGEARSAAALALADACERAGAPEGARAGLEQAFAAAPGDARLRGRLERLYEALGDARARAALKLRAADAADTDTQRFTELVGAGRILLGEVHDPAAALDALERAAALDAGDPEVTILRADALIDASRLEDAALLLDAAIAAHKGRRSRDVAVLQHRMARIARAVGDPANAMAWLNAALDCDLQSGVVAAELADVATELGQLEIALKALRAVTLMKSPEPMGRAVAYLRQAYIARHQGDLRRALSMARKAQMEDAQLAEAGALIAELSA